MCKRFTVGGRMPVKDTRGDSTHFRWTFRPGNRADTRGSRGWRDGWGASQPGQKAGGHPPGRGYVLEEFHLPPAAPPARPHPGGAREARPRHGCTADSELQQLEAVSTHAPHVGSLETGSMQWFSWPPHRDKRVFLVQRCKFFFL